MTHRCKADRRAVSAPYSSLTPKDALALVYALARKSLDDPARQPTAMRKIVEIVEKNFLQELA